MKRNWPGEIRRSFHDFLQTRGISITDEHESAVLNALIDAIGTEMIGFQEATGPIYFEELIRARNRYGHGPENVKTALEYIPGKGFHVYRDAEQGGGPYQQGPFMPSVEKAFAAFVEKYGKVG